MKMQLQLLVILAVLCMVLPGCLAKRYCKTKDDCSDLGELECVKSICEWGVCGCPHHTVTKFLGSDRLYGCVPLRHVGEGCSTDGDTGICGAENSFCNTTTGRCECDEDYVPVWGGEMCARPQRTTVGESCSPSMGQCELESDAICASPQANNNWPQQLLHGRPTCACPNTKTLRLNSIFMDFNDFDPISFVHKTVPGCFDRNIGDICLYNKDCPSNAECVSSKCVCKDTYVPDYFYSKCKKALSHGAECDGPNVNTNENHCDGSLGLYCKDFCYVDKDNSNNDWPTKCSCGPFHTSSGSSCTKIDIGDTCHGDFQCKGITWTAVCVDGKCQEP